MSWKSVVRSAFGRVGLDIRRAQPHKDPFEDQRRLLGPDGAKIIFDVGANRGKVTLHYRELFPAAEIHAFEPFPECVTDLRKNCAGDPRIHIHDVAVADAPGTRDFFLTKADPSNSLLSRATSTRRYYAKGAPSTTSIKVNVVTLDGIAQARGIDRIDILKFDIQGGELMALRGAEGLLKARRVSLIYTEVLYTTFYERQPVFHEIASFLAGQSYTLYDLYDAVRATNGQIKYGDAMFVSRELRAAVLDTAPEEP
jgi:FkbM family methyltransferase